MPQFPLPVPPRAQIPLPHRRRRAPGTAEGAESVGALWRQERLPTMCRAIPGTCPGKRCSNWSLYRWCCTERHALVGMLIPKLNQILIGPVVEYSSMQLLYAVMSFMFFASLGSILLSIIRGLLLNRIRYKLDLSVGAATMMRILSLPASFFKEYSAGELNQYIGYMNSLCDTLVNSIFSTDITGIFSLVYLTQIFAYAPSLVWPSLIVTILTLAISMISAFVQPQINKEKMVLDAKERGLVFSFINGIQKIRLSGAENRAFFKWSQIYSKGAEMVYNPPSIIWLSGGSLQRSALYERL